MNKTLFALILHLFLAISISYSQQHTFSYGNPEDFCIKGVTVSGIKFLDPNVIISLTNLSLGDTISIPSETITRAIKKLWDQELFSDVSISATRIDGKDIYLDIFLQELPRISGLNIDGVKKNDVKDLKELIGLRVGSQATENVLDNAVRQIEKHYRSKGFLNTAVEVIQVNDTSLANGVRITFLVDKKDRIKISNITFDGNEAFSDARLRRAMKKTKRRDWNIFKSSKFIESDFEDDQIKIIGFYNEHGYRDAQILRDSIFVVNEKRVGIHFFIDEGRQFFYRNIAWVGNSKLPDEALNDLLGIKRGDVYDRTLLEKRLFVDENSISTVYMDDGYLFFQLEPVEVRAQNDSIDIEMRIFEGEQATINRVSISGNTKTHEHVIRRELFSKPGDLFSKTYITRSLRELGNMGHFDPEKLDVKPLPNPSDGTVDLKFIVEEKANDQLEVSGGWGGNMFVGTIGVRFSNFSIARIFEKKSWRPVPTGDSQTLSLRAQTNGQQYRAVSLSFMEPWLGGKKPTNFSFTLYHTLQDYSKFFLSTTKQYMRVTGGAIGMGTRLKKPDDFFTLQHEIGLQNYVLRDWDYFIFKTGTSNNFSYKITLGRSSIDQPFYPRRGSTMNLSLQLTPPYSLISGKDFSSISSQDSKYKWVEYHKWTVRIQWFQTLIDKLVLYTGAQFGVLGYYNEDIGYSPFEGFYLGGDGMSGYNLYGRETIGLRGYTNGSLTPVTNGAQQSNIYNKYTMELRFPLTLQPQAAIYVLAFGEAGNSWYNINSYKPFNVHRSLGIGARFFLPMIGMLGVDWGYGFDRVPGDDKAHRGQFHFQIGMPF